MAAIQWKICRVRTSIILVAFLVLAMFVFWVKYYDLTRTGGIKVIPDDFKHLSFGKAQKQKIEINNNLQLSENESPMLLLGNNNNKHDSLMRKNGNIGFGGRQDTKHASKLLVKKGNNKQEFLTTKKENIGFGDSQDTKHASKPLVESKLLLESLPEQFSIIHKEYAKIVKGRKLVKSWTPPWIPRESYVFDTVSLPKNKRLMPSVGNGHVATVVHSDAIFMNGLYNGAGNMSHRARIPSPCAINITRIEPPVVERRNYSLDVVRGVYSETIVTNEFEVQERIYAHRSISQLIVVEIELVRRDPKLNIKLHLSNNKGKESKDIDFKEVNSNRQKVVHKVGQPKVAETITTPRPYVHLYYDEIPKQLTAPPGVKRCQWFFITSISSDKQDAIHGYELALKQIRQNTLLSSHEEAWASLWQHGRVDLGGSTLLAKAAYGSLYYILSSLPMKEDENGLLSFFGLSPTGLAHGNTEEDYLGHVFWDQETWMFPPILMFHSDISQLILKSRIRTREAAVEIAARNRLQGAQYPWESAVSGFGVSPSEKCETYEIHITGDISLALQNYLYMTDNLKFLSTDQGKYLALDTAKFWASRVHKNTTTGLYEILGVMGPDEYHNNVNNSVYTNTVAKLSLELGEYVNKLLKLPPEPLWTEISKNMYIPFDNTDKYHPEFDGYNYRVKKTSTVKQADVVLLGFPLEQKMPYETRRNDLLIYEKVTSLSGPSMTWCMYSIGWLELKDYEKARQMFMRNLAYIRQPFQVWTEIADGTGAVNFMTGMGGFLQNLLFGYAGIRIHKDNLEIDPVLPPDVKTFNLTGIDYMGSTFDFITEKSSTTIILKSEAIKNSKTFTLEIFASKWRQTLVVNKPLSIHNEKASIIPGHK